MKTPKNRDLNANKCALRSHDSRRHRHRIVVVLSAAAWLALAPFASAQSPPCVPNPTATPTPNTPLNDLGQGFYSNPPGNSPAQGGLYPGGFNQRPVAYNNTGLAIATTDIYPRDINGNRDDQNGKIVMISIGMCNSSMEFGGTLSDTIPRDGFQCRVTGVVNPDTSPSPSPPPCSQTPCDLLAANWKNPKLFVWDCAQGGMSAKEWARPSPTSNPWTQLDCRLAAAGLSKKQVQIVWLKEALAEPASYGAWPQHVQRLKNYLEEIIDHLVDSNYGFGNVKMVFLSPRTRAWNINPEGGNAHSPEPYAYETGFADQGLIRERIQDPTRSNWPWLSWGPYIWADGNKPRSDGLTWPASLLRQDCTHPLTTGVHTVADQLLAFFKTDPVATPWFLKAPNAFTVTVTTDDADNIISAEGSVKFTASVPGRTITEYAWTFDDGCYRYDPVNDPLKTTVTKKFPAPSQTGNPYKVHVTAIDSAGNAGVGTVSITVL